MAFIYCATTGNDTTGDGSIGTPYATPTKAHTEASAGDVIVGRGGTYTLENLDTAGDRGGMRFTSYYGENVLLEYGSTRNVFKPIDFMSNITFEYLEFSQTAADARGPFDVDETENVTVRHCRQTVSASHTETSRSFYSSSPSTAGQRNLSLDNILLDANGKNYKLFQGSLESSNFTSINSFGHAGLVVNIVDIRGHCVFTGAIKADTTGQTFEIDNSTHGAVVDFGEGLHLINEGQGAVLRVGVDNTADTIRVIGESLTCDGWDEAVRFVYGVSGHIQKITAIGRSDTSSNVPVAFRSDGAANTTGLSVKRFVVDELIVHCDTTLSNPHGVLLGHYSEHIVIRSGRIYTSGYVYVIKGDKHLLLADGFGGSLHQVYLKGGRDNLVSGNFHQFDAGNAVSIVEDDTNPSGTRHTSGNRVS